MTVSPIVRLAGCASLALMLSACADDRVWMRSGAGSSDAQIDEMDCAEQSEKSGVTISSDGSTGMTTDRFSNRYACLRSRGYKLKSLTSEEAAKLKSLGGVEREIYWNQLLTKYGFSPAAEKPAEASGQEPKPAVPN